jgi:hypothetical protein
MSLLRAALSRVAVIYVLVLPSVLMHLSAFFTYFSFHHSVAYNTIRVRYATELRACLVQLSFRQESARMCRRNLQLMFPGQTEYTLPGQRPENNKIIARPESQVGNKQC